MTTTGDDPIRPATRRARRAGFVAAVAVSVAMAGWLVERALHVGWFTAGNRYDTAVTVLFVLVPVEACASGLFVVWCRPGNRSGPLLVALGWTFAAWGAATASRGLAAAYGLTGVVVIRPLLFWAIVAWPIGRLRRADRPWIVAYTIAHALLGGAWIVLDPEAWDGAHRLPNPLALWDRPEVAQALASLSAFGLLPAGALTVIGVVIGRHRQLPPAARRLARPVVVAGVVAAATDPLLVFLDTYAFELLHGGGGRNAAGLAVYGLDLARFGLAPLLLAWAVARSGAAVTGRVRTVELGPAAARVQDAVAVTIGDPSTRIVYHRDGVGWCDGDGTPTAIGGDGRTVTVVDVDGVPVAAVEHDDRLDGRPTVVEVAVAAVASALEHERLAVLARSRLTEARTARRTIVEVEDQARQRVERDLHDGAQQRLVGLALQASLAARAGGTDDPAPLAAGLADARRELADLAAGELPALLAARGLAPAIATLAAATPLAVDVHLAVPASLPEQVSSTAWFVVAETVANTVKHANARRVWIDGRVVGDRFELSVRDDGTGAVTVRPGSGLHGLMARARAAGGELSVRGEPGTGTTVRFDVAVTP